jgi:hypothetical protein
VFYSGVSSMSCVRGTPWHESFSGAPSQPCPFCIRRYSSCKPATNCDCCCSSISTYLWLGQRLLIIEGEGTLTLSDKPCRETSCARQTRRWHCPLDNDRKHSDHRILIFSDDTDHKLYKPASSCYRQPVIVAPWEECLAVPPYCRMLRRRWRRFGKG